MTWLSNSAGENSADGRWGRQVHLTETEKFPGRKSSTEIGENFPSPKKIRWVNSARFYIKINFLFFLFVQNQPLPLSVRSFTMLDGTFEKGVLVVGYCRLDKWDHICSCRCSGLWRQNKRLQSHTKWQVKVERIHLPIISRISQGLVFHINPKKRGIWRNVVVYVFHCKKSECKSCKS